jgi:hypothetical protein
MGASTVCFDARELSQILNVYAHFVAAGEWRDYALDFDREAATFSIYRRASEQPLYRIRKCPQLARKQGAYMVLAPGGTILKRGEELEQILRLFLRKRLTLVQ